ARFSPKKTRLTNGAEGGPFARRSRGSRGSRVLGLSGSRVLGSQVLHRTEDHEPQNPRTVEPLKPREPRTPNLRTREPENLESPSLPEMREPRHDAVCRVRPVEVPQHHQRRRDVGRLRETRDRAKREIVHAILVEPVDEPDAEMARHEILA